MNPERTFVGILAQEIQEVAPYMVETIYLGQQVEEDENGVQHILDEGTPYLSYDASALDYMLINAVQEQQETIESQENELEEMRQLLLQLQQRVDAMEQR